MSIYNVYLSLSKLADILSDCEYANKIKVDIDNEPILSLEDLKYEDDSVIISDIDITNKGNFIISVSSYIGNAVELDDANKYVEELTKCLAALTDT